MACLSPCLEDDSCTATTAAAAIAIASTRGQSQLLSVSAAAAMQRAPCLMYGPQSRSPASKSDSRLTCSEFTWTLNTQPPPLPPPTYCTCGQLMYALIVWLTRSYYLVVQHLIPAISVVYGEWVNLAIVSICHLVLQVTKNEHPYVADSDMLFHLLLTNVLIVSCFG